MANKTEQRIMGANNHEELAAIYEEIQGFANAGPKFLGRATNAIQARANQLQAQQKANELKAKRSEAAKKAAATRATRNAQIKAIVPKGFVERMSTKEIAKKADKYRKATGGSK